MQKYFYQGESMIVNNTFYGSFHNTLISNLGYTSNIIFVILKLEKINFIHILFFKPIMFTVFALQIKYLAFFLFHRPLLTLANIQDLIVHSSDVLCLDGGDNITSNAAGLKCLFHLHGPLTK